MTVRQISTMWFALRVIREVGRQTCDTSWGFRNQALRYIHQKGGVLLTTYGMVLHNVVQLMHATASGGSWDALILDEVTTMALSGGTSIEKQAVDCQCSRRCVCARSLYVQFACSFSARVKWQGNCRVTRSRTLQRCWRRSFGPFQ